MLDASVLTSTPMSLTSDILISLVLALILTGYVLHSGVEKIILVAFAIYAAVTIQAAVFFVVPSIGPIPGSVAVLFFLIIAGFVTLHRSVIGRTIACNKKSKAIHILFGISVAGLLLVQIIPSLSLLNTPYSRFLQQSLFGQESIQLLWTVAPLVLLPFISIRKKK